MKNRTERKVTERLLYGTQQGQEMRAMKRIHKTEKKKEKRREKAIEYAFSK